MATNRVGVGTDSIECHGFLKAALLIADGPPDQHLDAEVGVELELAKLRLGPLDAETPPVDDSTRCTVSFIHHSFTASLDRSRFEKLPALRLQMRLAPRFMAPLLPLSIDT